MSNLMSPTRKRNYKRSVWLPQRYSSWFVSLLTTRITQRLRHVHKYLKQVERQVLCVPSPHRLNLWVDMGSPSEGRSSPFPWDRWLLISLPPLHHWGPSGSDGYGDRRAAGGTAGDGKINPGGTNVQQYSFFKKVSLNAYHMAAEMM